MTSDLTGPQNELRNRIAAFARAHLAPGALARAHDPSFPFDVALQLADLGLLGLTIPKVDGGQGGDLMDAVIAIEEVAAACPRSADVVQSGNFGAARVLAEFGTEDQKERFLKPVLEGRSVISTAMSEPDAGSAVTALETSAVADDGGGWRITGTKVWGNHSVEAAAFLVYVRFGEGTGNIGSVLVPRDAPGLTISEPGTFMSGEQWCRLDFRDCAVPARDVLLPAGGFKKQMSGFNVERIGNTARSLAVGRHAFEVARAYAMTRKQFGRRLCEFQGIQWMFAEMAVKLAGAQLLLYKAARDARGGLPSAADTAIAKLACNAAGFEVADASMQVMGALGYSRDTLVEFCVRRCRGWMIAGGSTEMLKNKVAEAVFGERFSQRPDT